MKKATVFAQSLPNFTCIKVDEGRNPVDFEPLGHGSRSPFGLCLLNLVGMKQATILAQSLLNFICKFLMMRGETLLFWVMGSNVVVNFDPL